MRVKVMIRPIETQVIEIEAPDFETGKKLLEESIPDGWAAIQWTSGEF
jgi:hypothetical protein